MPTMKDLLQIPMVPKFTISKFLTLQRPQFALKAKNGTQFTAVWYFISLLLVFTSQSAYASILQDNNEYDILSLSQNNTGIAEQLQYVILPDHWFTDRQVQAVLTKQIPVSQFQQWTCLTKESCITNPQNLSVSCAPGYEGPLCAICSQKYGAAGGGQCVKCGNAARNWTLLVILVITAVIIAFVAIVRVLKQRDRPLSLPGVVQREVLVTLKILFNFLQALSILADFDVPWTRAVKELFGVAGTTSGLSLNLSFVNCALNWNAREKSVLFFALPYVILVLPGIILVSARMLYEYRTMKQLGLVPRMCACRSSNDTKAQQKEVTPLPPLLFFGVTPTGLYSTVIMVLLFLLYPTATRASLSIIKCSEPIDGVQYVIDDYSITCEEARRDAVAILGWIQLAAFSFGFPICSALILFQKRTILHHDRIRRRYSFLYSGYRSQCYWFETAVMARKFALAGAAVVLADKDVGYQLFWAIMVLFTSLMMQLWLEPFNDKLHNIVEQVTLMALIVIILLGQLCAFGVVSTGIETFISVLIAIITCIVSFVCVGILVYDVYKSAQNSRIVEKLKMVWSRQDGDGTSQKNLTPVSRIVSFFSRQARRRRKLTGRPTMTPSMQSELANLRHSHDSITDKTGRISRNSQTSERLSGVKVSSTYGAPQRPSVWEKRTHPLNPSMEYYVNTLTGKTQWDKPEALEEAEDEDARTSNAWVVFKHPQVGLPYYWNSQTKEVTWTRPPEMPLRENECWEIRLHAETGVPYYFNSMTENFSWTQPSDFVPNVEQIRYLESLKQAAAAGVPPDQPPVLQGAAAIRAFCASQVEPTPFPMNSSDSTKYRTDRSNMHDIRRRSLATSSSSNIARARLTNRSRASFASINPYGPSRERSQTINAQRPIQPAADTTEDSVTNPMCQNTHVMHRPSLGGTSSSVTSAIDPPGNMARSSLRPSRSFHEGSVLFTSSPIRRTQGDEERSRPHNAQTRRRSSYMGPDPSTSSTYRARFQTTSSHGTPSTITENVQENRGDTRSRRLSHIVQDDNNHGSAVQEDESTEVHVIDNVDGNLIDFDSGEDQNSVASPLSVRGPWECYFDQTSNEYYWINQDTLESLWQQEFEELQEEEEANMMT